MEISTRNEFNSKLLYFKICTDLAHEELWNHVKVAANKVVNEDANNNNECFDHSKMALQLLVVECNALMYQSKLISDIAMDKDQ